MRIIALLLLFLSTNVYSQSVFRFIGRGAALKVTRTITSDQINMALARNILLARGVENIVTVSPVMLQATYSPGIVTPSMVVGPNNYLKGVSRSMKGASEWARVNTEYNGAHHIVTKFVIRTIGGSEDAIKNGPSVFHPLHNRPEYIDVFHNHQRQLELYKESGIKGIVEDFFDKVPGFTEEDRKIMLLESELWSKHWGFKWR